jgi:hypothetical protein
MIALITWKNLLSFYTKDGKRVSFATDRKVGHKEVVQFTADGEGKK